MSDAQDEAERIVHRACGVAAQGALGIQGSWEGRAHVDRLVAALAATFEAEDAENAIDVQGMAGLERLYRTRRHRSEALSALRQTDGEDT